jgi:hypothetical protein
MEKKLGEKLDGKYCNACRKAINGSKFKDIYGQ